MQFPFGMAYFRGYVGFRLREGEVILSLSSSTSACSVFVWIWFLLDAWKPAPKKGEKNNLNTGKPVKHEGHYGSLQIKRLFTHWVHQDWTATTNPYHSFLVGVWTNPCEKYKSNSQTGSFCQVEVKIRKVFETTTEVHIHGGFAKLYIVKYFPNKNCENQKNKSMNRLVCLCSSGVRVSHRGWGSEELPNWVSPNINEWALRGLPLGK